jgi:hypothetical protein
VMNVVRILSALVVAIFFITEAASAQTTPIPAAPAMSHPTALPHAVGTPGPKKCQNSGGCKKKKKKKKKQQAASGSPHPMGTPMMRQGTSPVTPHPALSPVVPAPAGPTAPGPTPKP